MNYFARLAWLVLFGLLVGCKTPQTLFRPGSFSAFATPGDAPAGSAVEFRADPEATPGMPTPPSARPSLRGRQYAPRRVRGGRVRPSSLAPRFPRTARAEQAAAVHPHRNRPLASVKDGPDTLGKALQVMFWGAVFALVLLIGLFTGLWPIGLVGLLGLGVCIYLLRSGDFMRMGKN